MRKTGFRHLFAVALLFLSLSGCGYNTLQEQAEWVKATWAQVLNQYQRRADLVPALVGVVKAYAAHEKSVFEEIAQARAHLENTRVSTAALNDATALEQYSQAQKRMSTALERLLLVAENYPQLKADGVFRDLQIQLEGTENRIAFARTRYIDAVAAFNISVRSFPSNLTAKYLSYEILPTFSVDNEGAISKAPTVSIK